MDQAELPKHILPFQNIPLALALLGSLKAISFEKIKNTMLKGYTEIVKICGTALQLHYNYSAFALFAIS